VGAVPEEVVEMLKAVEVDRLTPLEALTLLAKVKGLMDSVKK
jgi:hypothetical protein